MQPEFQIERLNLDIDTGHRLLNHSGKCGSPHGHRYSISVAVAAPTLDDVGVVVDFSVLKGQLGKWLDMYWDHTMLLEVGDPLVRVMYAGWKDAGQIGAPHGSSTVTPHPEVSAVGRDKRPCFLLPYAPSAENIARYLYEVVCPFVFEADLSQKRFRIVHVQVAETPNCIATYPAPPDVQALLQRIEQLEKKLEERDFIQRLEQEALEAASDLPKVQHLGKQAFTPTEGVFQDSRGRAYLVLCTSEGTWCLHRLEDDDDEVYWMKPTISFADVDTDDWHKVNFAAIQRGTLTGRYPPYTIELLKRK